MKSSVISTLHSILRHIHFVRLWFLLMAMYMLSACSGAGAGNAEVEGMNYGLRLSIVEGNNQQAKAGDTFALPLKVKLSDTAGSPVQNVKITFKQVAGEDQAAILTKTIMTSSDGTAETRIKAPDRYDSVMTIQAIIEETNLKTEFSLKTTPTGMPSKILVQTSHGEIEQAGVPFAYIFRLTDELGNTVKYNGSLTVNLTVNTPAKSWAGNEPNLPMSAITCLFTDGLCQTAATYTLVNSDSKTFLTISSGSLTPEVNKEVTVIPSAEFQVVVATKAGGPAASATPALSYEGLTVLNTDLPGIDFYGAIVDIGGNYLRDATAADGVVWSAVKSNGTSFTEIDPDLTPISGGSGVHYGLTKTVITPNILRIRAAKTGINSDDTGNIQVDPGNPAQLKVWTDHNQIESAGTGFKLQAQILDAKGNLCTTTPTKAGISGTGSGSLSFQNSTFGTLPSIRYASFTGLTSSLNFFNGTLIPLSSAIIPKAHKDPAAVATKPTISMRVVMPVIDLVTTGFDLTGVTEPITIVPTAPKRLSFRSDTNNNGSYADDAPCTSMAPQFYDPSYGNDPNIFYTCLDSTAGSVSSTLYTVIEDRGGNPLQWNGSAWEMTDLNGTPVPVVVDGWNPTGSSLFNFSPVTATSSTVFNPVQAGYSNVTLKLNDAAKGVNLATTYTSLVTTGNVNTFFAETYDGAHGSSNLISAPNTFTLRLVALDATGNTVFGFNGTQSFTFSITPLPTASPKGTAANFPSTINATFVNGEALVTGLKLPNAQVNKLTTFSGGTTVNGDAKTTNTVNITVDVGNVASLQIRDQANNAGNDLTGQPLIFNADTPPTVYVASYDSELNFYRDEVGTWATSGTALSNAVSILTLAQSNPVNPLTYCAGNNLGTITATVGPRTVATGQISIVPGAYQQVVTTVRDISTASYVTTVSAGTTYNLRVVATDQYLNKITTFNGSKNLVFTTSGNGTTRKGYSQNLPANGAYNFVSGEVSPTPTFKLYNSSFTPRVIVDETTSVPGKTGQTVPLTVLNDVPYNFYITRSTLYLNAGSNAYFYTYLQDVWGNTITSGGQENAQIKFYFDSTLGGTDILFTNLTSSSINSGTDELTGNLVNGAGAIQVTAQKAGNLRPNAVLTAGPMPNPNDTNDIIVLPLTTVDQLQWVAGSSPQNSYTASKSVPFSEFKVEAVDVYGNRVTTDTSSITLSVINPASGTTAGTIIGTATKSLDQGTINFTDIKYPRAHTMTIRATHSATGKNTDAAVNVTAGLPNQALVILAGQSVVTGVTTAAEAVLGSPAAQLVDVSYPVQVYIMDEVFNPVLTWGNSISVGITDDSGATITPSATNFVSGTATFTVTSHKQGSHQIIPNASSILNNLTSSFFTVNPGAPTRLVAVFPTQTLNQGASSLATAITNGGSVNKTAGVSFSMTVYATDNYFNIVSDSSTVIGLTLNNDSLATYGTSLPMVNGSVTFPNIRFFKALASSQIGVTVVSSPTTFSNIHGSSTFAVNPNTATQTVPYLPSYQSLVTGQLSLANAVSGTIPNIKAGTLLNVKVAITDDYYNPVTSYVTPLTINLSDANVSSPGNSTPSNGEAIFGGVQWITLSNAATCQANATGLTNQPLSTFNVIPSDGRQTIAVLQGQTYTPGKTSLASAVAWTAGAQTRTAGVSYTVDIYLTDDYFNTITAASDTVGINLTTDGTAPTVANKAMTSGRATFTVANTKADVAHTLRATSSFTNNNSTAFTVVPASAYQTAVFLPGENYNPGYTTMAQAKTSAPNTQTAGTSFTATIRVLDQYFNVVNTSGSFTLTSNDTNAVITTTSTFTNGVGTAIVTNYTANNANTLTLTGTGYSPQHNSSSYIVNPEGTRYLITTLDGLGESIVAGKLTYSAAVSGTLAPVNADVAFNVSVSARDKYFNLINDNTTTVAINSPSDPFAVLPASKPLSNGIANFAIKNHRARYNYLAASGTAYTSVNSNNYWVNWLADENLVILLPGQSLNQGASALNINSTTHPNAITGTPATQTSGQSANLTVYVTDKFFNQTDSAAGSYNYSLTFNDDPYAVGASAASIVSATATFAYTPLRATTSQKITPVLTTGSITNIYTTPFFTVNPGTLEKTEVLLPNQTLVTGTTSRTVALAYPASYTTNTDANFSVVVYALDHQHNVVPSASSTISVKDQADANQATYNANLTSGTVTLSVEPVTPGANHYFQVTNAPSIAATHATSDLYTINIGTPSKVLVQFPGQTFTPARRSGLQGLTGSITNQTVGNAFNADVIVTDSKFNVVPVAWNINAAFLSDNYGSITPSALTTTNGSATVSVFNQVAATHSIAMTPSTGPLSGNQYNSASYTAVAGTAVQTILVMTGQTHTPGPASATGAITGTATAVTAGNSTSATMKLVDQYFNVVNSNAAGASLSDDIESAHISPSTTSFSSGVANFNVTPIRAGTHTISTNYAGVASHTGSTLTVNPGASTLTIAYFNTQTYQNGVTTLAAAVSGAQPAVTADDTVPVNVRVVDNYYNTVTSYNGTTTLNTTDPVDTEPTAAITSGVGSLNISPVRAGSWAMSAAVSGKTAQNTNFTVSHGAPYQLVVKLPDQTFTPGQTSIASAITPVAAADRVAGTAFNANVYLTDAEFNTATTGSSTINASWVGDTNGLINTATPLVLSSGAGTLNVTPKLAGTARKIRVTPTVALTGGTDFDSTAFNITPSAPARIIATLPGETFTEGSATLTGTPNTQTAGTAFNVRLRVTDAQYNTVSNFTGTLDLTSTDFNFSSGGGLSITSGSAATGLISVLSNTKTSSETATAWKFSPTSTNMSGITLVDSSYYGVNANVSAKIYLALDSQTYSYNTTTHAYAVSGSASTATAGTDYNVTAHSTDAYNNPTTDNSVQVGLATANDSYAVLASPAYLTNGSVGLTVNHHKAGSGYILTSTSTPSLTSVNSSAYNVNPGAPYTIVGLLQGENISAPGAATRAAAITGTPVSQTAGTAFNFTTKLVDQYYNAITSAAYNSKVISLTLNNDSLATAPANLNLTNGAATFSVTNKKAGTNLSITATTTGLTQNSDTSNVYTVLPDSVSRLLAMLPGEAHNAGSTTLSGSPSTLTAGTSFAITVKAVDQFYNDVPLFSGAKALSFSTSAQNSPNSTAPSLAADTNYTFTGGETTVNNFTLYKAISSSGTITVTMASPALSTSTTAITVQPAAAVATIKVKDTAGNGGSEVGAVEYSTLDTNPTFYAAGYDAYGNYKSDVSSTWSAQRSVAGDLDASLSTTSAAATQLNLTSAGPGTLSLKATTAGVSDTTGTLTILEQGAEHFLAELESVGSKTADAAFNLKLTAQRSNSSTATSYAGVKTISLSSNALAGAAGCTSLNVNPELPASATFTAGVALVPVKLKKVQTGVTITASSANVASGTTAGFNVNPGSIACLQIRTAASGTGSAISSTVNLSAFENSFVYAHGYDSNMNNLGDQAAAWTSSGTVTSYYSPTTGTSTYARVTGAQAGSGTLTATVSGISEQISYAVATGGATLSAASTDAYSKAQLLSNNIESGLMWNAQSDDYTAWKTNNSMTWYNESASAHRGLQASFPDRVFVTVTDQEISIVDAKTLDLYMRFVKGANNIFSSGFGTAQSLTARNGKLYVGFTNGLLAIDFVNDMAHRLMSGAHDRTTQLSLRNNNAVSWSANATYPAFSNYNFKHLKSYYESSIDFVVAGLNQAIQVIKDNSGTITLASGPSTTGTITALGLTSAGGIYYGEAGFGVHFAQPNYSALAAFSSTAAQDISASQVNDIHVEASLSTAEAGRDIIYLATNDGLISVHDHSTAASRAFYNYGLASDGLTGFSSYLRQTSSTVSGIVSVADHGARPSTDVTVEFFFKPQTTITGARTQAVLVDKATTGSADGDFGVVLGTDSSLTFYTYQASSLYSITTANTTWNANQWYHITGQINSAGRMSLWINGTLESTIDLSLTPALSNAAPLRLYSNSAYSNAAATDFSFDELRVSSSARFAFNAATISVPATPYTDDATTSYLLHFDTNSVTDSSSAAAAVTVANGVHVVKPFYAGAQRALTSVTAFSNGSTASGHIVTGNTGKLIELRHMQNPTTMSENSVANSLNTLHVDYYNKTSPTNFDYIQWNPGTGLILWAR